MEYKEILDSARTCIGPYCKACPVCNGKACGNQVPGPGAKAPGSGFIRNFDAWQKICVNMDTICPNEPVDTAVELFGTMYRYPFFAAPLGAMKLHYGEKYTDREYNSILVNACADSGIAAFTGDGVDAAVFQGAMEAIRTAGGVGVPTIKPWNQELVFEKLDLARTSGCKAVAMDIDGAGLPFLKNMTPPAGSKSVQELAEIIRYAGMPFIVKGVMTVRGAQKAAEAGAAAIIVSNHGGRVLGQTLDGLVCRVVVNEKVKGVQTHYAVHIANRAQLVIRQVTGHITQRAAVGVGCDEGLLRDLHEIPEARLVQVGNVEHHALLLHAANSLLAGLRQAVVLAGQRTRAELVRLVPRQNAVAAAEIIVAVDPAEVLAHRGHALDADENVDLAVGVRLHHLVIRVDNAERLALGDLRLGSRHDLLGALDIVHVIRGIDPDDEDAAFHAALAQPLEVAAVKYVRLAVQPARRYITPDVRVCIKIHNFPPNNSQPACLR